MKWLVFDENNLRTIPPNDRLSQCENILKNESNQSKRWDAVWLVGEAAREAGSGPIFEKASDLLAWVLENDVDGVVKHEVCFQISESNMREKIPHLAKAGLYNESALARHEAIESLAAMEGFEVEDEIVKALQDQVDYVRDTASFGIKYLDRLKHLNNEYYTDEYNQLSLFPEKRLRKYHEILKNESDESIRWDMVWLAGEIAENVGTKHPIFAKVEELCDWVLKNDQNSFVKHEACFQMAARNMRRKIPDLEECILNNETDLVRHEAIESLGLLSSFDSKKLISKFLTSSNIDIKQTAEFVLKRFEIMQSKNQNTY